MIALACRLFCGEGRLWAALLRDYFSFRHDPIGDMSFGIRLLGRDDAVAQVRAIEALHRSATTGLAVTLA